MKISVVINNFNYERYISEAIQSVIDQQFAAYEIIIVDDESSDSSVAIVEDFVKQDQRVKLCVQENQGQLMAILNGVKAASGDVICLLDADDIYHPNHLGEVAKTFIEHPSLGMRFNDVESFNREGVKKRYHHVHYYGDMGVTCISQYVMRKFLGNVTSSLSFRSVAADQIVFYMENYPYKHEWRLRADNCVIWLVSLFGFTKYNSDKMTVGYRIHGENGFNGKDISDRKRMEHIVIKSRFFELAAQELGIGPWLLKNVLKEFKNSKIKHDDRLALYLDCAKEIYQAERKGAWVDKQMHIYHSEL